MKELVEKNILFINNIIFDIVILFYNFIYFIRLS